MSDNPWTEDRERRASKARLFLYVGLLLVGLGFAVMEALLDECEEAAAREADRADDALRARYRERDRRRGDRK